MGRLLSICELLMFKLQLEMLDGKLAGSSTVWTLLLGASTQHTQRFDCE